MGEANRSDEGHIAGDEPVALRHQVDDAGMVATGRAVHPLGEGLEVVLEDLRHVQVGVDGPPMVGQGDAITPSERRRRLRVHGEEERQRPDVAARESVVVENRIEGLTVHEAGERRVGAVADLLRNP